MISERYCRRCGEDSDEFFLCDWCETEFCVSCGTNSELTREVCEACQQLASEVIKAFPAFADELESASPAASEGAPETKGGQDR